LSHVLVLTTLPDRDAADALGRSLVEARLAACVSVGAPVQSIYHWRGSIETSSEVPLTIKTGADLFDAVAAAIRAAHPYELPEILAVPVCNGTPDYLAWLDAETRIR
jgi:periplasmic divalent cation tolerance protein